MDRLTKADILIIQEALGCFLNEGCPTRNSVLESHDDIEEETLNVSHKLTRMEAAL
jgi:hypothetical protein